jgi:hypothetical protein
MPTSVATPSDLKKLQDQILAQASVIEAQAKRIETHAQTLDDHAGRLQEHENAAAASREAEAEMLARIKALESPPQLSSIASRIMCMNIGSSPASLADGAHLDKIARASLVVVRGGLDQSRATALISALKQRNPSIRVGSYTCPTECQPNEPAKADIANKLTEAGWWLLNAAGQKVQYTTLYGAYDINLTEWTKPDANGDRFPQWFAKRNAQAVAGQAWDFIYSDNAFYSPRPVKDGKSDWKCVGVDIANSDPTVVASYRKGMASYWQALTEATGLQVYGNADGTLAEAEYTKRLWGAFYEGPIGVKDATEEWGGWLLMWQRYVGRMQNVKDPSTVGLRVGITSRETMLYGLATALLGDGMMCPTDLANGYVGLPWYPEFDLRIGKPLDPIPAAALSGSTIYGRRYEGGYVLVNTSKTEQSSINLPDFGAVTMAPRSGQILTKS